MSIEVVKLGKWFNQQHAVREISFSVKPGEIVGFLGPNGAGKTTTMRMITGGLDPSGGEARIAGVDVIAHPLAARRKLGYLPESNPLYLDMYVREYLVFVASVYKVVNKKARIEEMLEKTGLLAESNKRLGQLSKGYRQRAGLAAALIHSPEVLILDEPTTGLDPNQIIEIRQLIREQAAHSTILFSSHILQEVEAICTRVIIINKGSIVADDSIAALRNRDKTNKNLEQVFRELTREVKAEAAG